MENGVMRSCGRQIEKENCFFYDDDVIVVVVNATAYSWLNSGWILFLFLFVNVVGCCKTFFSAGCDNHFVDNDRICPIYHRPDE